MIHSSIRYMSIESSSTSFYMIVLYIFYIVRFLEFVYQFYLYLIYRSFHRWSSGYIPVDL